MSQEKIRESAIAGSWYSDHPQTLKGQIGTYLDQVQPVPLGGTLVGLIAPHAGYLYSGGVAACAYKTLLEQPFDRVLILAPSHRASFPGASVYRFGGYRTPLGIVPLDQELIDALCQDSTLFHYVSRAETQEHSLEIQLPFLQVVLPAFRLTPILMGDQSLPTCRKLADAIIRACEKERVLLIASTDLSHFHPDQEAKRLDQVVIDRVSAFDPVGLAEALAQWCLRSLRRWAHDHRHARGARTGSKQGQNSALRPFRGRDRGHAGGGRIPGCRLCRQSRQEVKGDSTGSTRGRN